MTTECFYNHYMLMAALNVEDQVQCKISRTVQEHGHLHPEASRRK
jgi:hypothetical protein